MRIPARPGGLPTSADGDGRCESGSCRYRGSATGMGWWIVRTCSAARCSGWVSSAWRIGTPTYPSPTWDETWPPTPTAEADRLPCRQRGSRTCRGRRSLLLRATVAPRLPAPSGPQRAPCAARVIGLAAATRHRADTLAPLWNRRWSGCRPARMGPCAPDRRSSGTFPASLAWAVVACRPQDSLQHRAPR